MEPVEVDGKPVGPDSPPFVIAEIGMNHNGDVELGREQVEAAADAGADAVKFQSFSTEEFIAPHVSGREERKQYELDRTAHEELQSTAHEHGLTFLSTPFDSGHVELLDDLDVPCFKIASSDLTNLPHLKHVASKGKPVILSTGYSSLSEVATAVETIEATGNDQLVLLHCISEYPTPVEGMELKTIRTLSETFDIPVGLSDHSKHSPVAPTVATALGAAVIEKHFTVDNDLPGYDHAMSENPETFARMTDQVAAAHESLGSGRVKPTDGEREKIPGVRRSLYWADSYSAGTEITAEMLRPMRPGGEGLTPARRNELVGHTLAADAEAGDPVEVSDVNWAGQ